MTMYRRKKEREKKRKEKDMLALKCSNLLMRQFMNGSNSFAYFYTNCH